MLMISIGSFERGELLRESRLHNDDSQRQQRLSRVRKVPSSVPCFALNSIWQARSFESTMSSSRGYSTYNAAPMR